MVNSAVLVLNRSYMPVNVTSIRRAFILLYKGLAEAINERYETFDFDSWREVSVARDEATIRVVDGVIKVPSVIILQTFNRLPKRQVKFSRINIYARDNNTCQYCGKTFPKNELTLDHVIPRGLGGKSNWENVACSCVSCNIKKGGRTPADAGMRLIRPPDKPRWTPYLRFSMKNLIQKEWLPFLNIVDTAYWNLELRE